MGIFIELIKITLLHMLRTPNNRCSKKWAKPALGCSFLLPTWYITVTANWGRIILVQEHFEAH